MEEGVDEDGVAADDSTDSDDDPTRDDSDDANVETVRRHITVEAKALFALACAKTCPNRRHDCRNLSGKALDILLFECLEG